MNRVTSLRLLHVVSSLNPAAGGPPLVATRLAAAQAALGHQVSVAAWRDLAAQADIERSLAGVPAIERVKWAFVPSAGRCSALRTGLIANSLSPLLHESDLVHLHGVWDPLVKAAASAAARGKIPYAIAPHGMLDPWSLRQKAWKKRLAMALGYRRMLDGAAFLHLLNDDEERLIAPLELRCPKVVIPNGIFLEEIPPGRGNDFFRDRLGIDGKQVVLFLSRLHHKKGLDHLAAAFDLLARQRPEIHLAVAGPDGGEQSNFEADIARRGLEKKVHLLGPLYGADKWAALASAGCFCLPSRQEGFSIAILEALAARLPVVISDACHFPQVAAAEAGFIVPLEPAAIAAALEQALDEKSAGRMGKNGFDLVATRYTWSAIALQSLAAYQTALGASGVAAKGSR